MLVAMPGPPLKKLRIYSLALVFVLSAVGGSVFINALEKSNHQESGIFSSLPSGVEVVVDTRDIHQSGIAMGLSCALLLISSVVFILFLTIPALAEFSSRTLHYQTLILLGCCIWLFASLVPFTYYVAQHKAGVTAYLGTMQLPQSIVQDAQAALGLSFQYKKISYLVVVAVIPWFTLVSAIVATVISFIALWRYMDSSPRSYDDKEAFIFGENGPVKVVDLREFRAAPESREPQMRESRQVRTRESRQTQIRENRQAQMRDNRQAQAQTRENRPVRNV